MSRVVKDNVDYKVTVIMSNYNQGHLLKTAIESVLKQEVNFKYKILITDDCSKEDDSYQVIESYVNKHDNIKAIYADENGGYLANILRAKRQTDTDYFCLLDADDFWIDNRFLQKAFDFLEANKDYAIYESNVFVMPIESTERNYFNLKKFVQPHFKSGTYTKDMYVSNKAVPITQTTGMFFRNTIFINGIPDVMQNAVGTYSERSFEGDMDRFVMHLKTGKAYYSDETVGVYRLSQSGIWTRLSKSEKYLITARTYMDYYSYYLSDIDFFVEKAWKYLQMSIDEKHKEISKLTNCSEIVSINYTNILNSIYNFCACNMNTIDYRKYSVSFKQRIKKTLLIWGIGN